MRQNNVRTCHVHQHYKVTSYTLEKPHSIRLWNTLLFKHQNCELTFQGLNNIAVLFLSNWAVVVGKNSQMFVGSNPESKCFSLKDTSAHRNPEFPFLPALKLLTL